MNLLEKFQSNLLQFELIHPRDRVLIAVSGGVDSTVLLDLFCAVQERFQLELMVVHLNHDLRGLEALNDAKFVSECAERYNVEYYTEKVDTRSYARRKRIGIEEAARILRYNFFEDALKRHNYNKVAVAHNADDQAETLLDRLMRGAGVRGLSGISMQRGPYIRPLLNISRPDIETHAMEHTLESQLDSSNWELKYKRNRIRHELMPYLAQQFNPQIRNTLMRTCNIFREVETYLLDRGEDALKACLLTRTDVEMVLDLPQFSSHPVVIQQYILFNIFYKLHIRNGQVTFELMDRLQQLAREHKSGNRIKIAANWEAVVYRDQLVFHQRQNEDFEILIPVGKKQSIFGGDIVFNSRLLRENEKRPNFLPDSNLEYVDFGKIRGELRLRTPREGDRFRPLNMRGAKKLSDFFIDEKIPNYLRGRVPVLECQDSIIWVCGYRIDDRYKITARTKQILELEINEGLHE
ncbi:tRNA lysidine(34) synthetase TilS [bacterium]|nr:tRNA lysidine(34) synthetase TilS [bacterium]